MDKSVEDYRHCFWAALEDLIRVDGHRTGESPKRRQGEGATVLLVEDSKVLRDVYTAILRHAGCRTIAAGDGREALLAIRDRWIDLAVVDLALPGMDGFELTSALRFACQNRSLRVVMISAASGPVLREIAVRCGADELLLKSEFSIGRLLEMVEEILVRPAVSASAA